MAAPFPVSLLDTTMLSAHSRTAAVVRLMLAVGALIVILIDPTEPARYVNATYATLVLYVLFSLVIYFIARRPHESEFAFWTNPYWIDIGWYFLLVALSSGTSTIFFFFFYFAIANCSFTRGSRTGFASALVSAAGFTILAYFSTSPDKFELDRFLLRPIALAILGYQIAYWGGLQMRNFRRLKLLREIGLISNPRFGVNRTVGVSLALLRRFFSADACMVVTRVSATGEYRMRRCDDASPDGAIIAKPIDKVTGELLTAVPKNLAAVYENGTTAGLLGKRKLCSYDCVEKEYVQPDIAPFDQLSHFLEASTYLTAPIQRRGETSSRIYLLSNRSLAFHQSDIDFLLQAISSFIPIVDNIDLIDRMASDAAEEERKRIARDIHDSVIQPYIGLQMGIDSLVDLLHESDEVESPGERMATAKARADKLKQLTDEGLLDLRQYIRGLADAQASGANLEPSLRRFTEKFAAATGIKVQTEMTGSIKIADRLAAELFQMVAEGLSNVRRHTDSQIADVSIHGDENRLLLTISNTVPPGTAFNFVPMTISQRAESLGGNVEIVQNDDRLNVVVEIPL